VALRRSLGKDADGPVSRWLNRPVSTRLSMALAPLRPAPDLVSLVAFALGLAGAALLAAGQGLAGALLVHASSVADGMDGEVARLQLRGGPRGALLDGVLDRVADGAVLAGLGLWALDGHDAPGGAGADRGRHRRGAAVDGVQGPGGRPGAATCARAGAGVAAWWPGRALGRGRAAGRPSRGPGRGRGHLGAVARVAFLRRPPAA
jgi:CDP-alcohol phosphatidyltransferase